MDPSGKGSDAAPVPGKLPGTPTAVKVLRTDDGITLSWGPPEDQSVIEYSVYMAIKGPTLGDDQQNLEKIDNMLYACIYKGPNNSCQITKEHIMGAYLSKMPEYAFIFRIAAKNERGYGPATRFKWIQGAPAFMAGSESEEKKN